MNSQLFLILNVALAGIFVIWFLMGRKSSESKGTTLDLSKGEKSEPNLFREQIAKRRQHKNYNPPLLEEDPHPQQSSAKELNILFIYNGHSFDAYQVLGLPAGASLPVVTAKYQELIRYSDKNNFEFLEAAYHAILKRK